MPGPHGLFSLSFHFLSTQTLLLYSHFFSSLNSATTVFHQRRALYEELRRLRRLRIASLPSPLPILPALRQRRPLPLARKLPAKWPPRQLQGHRHRRDFHAVRPVRAPRHRVWAPQPAAQWAAGGRGHPPRSPGGSLARRRPPRANQGGAAPYSCSAETRGDAEKGGVRVPVERGGVVSDFVFRYGRWQDPWLEWWLLWSLQGIQVEFFFFLLWFFIHWFVSTWFFFYLFIFCY